MFKRPQLVDGGRRVLLANSKSPGGKGGGNEGLAGSQRLVTILTEDPARLRLNAS